MTESHFAFQCTKTDDGYRLDAEPDAPRQTVSVCMMAGTQAAALRGHVMESVLRAVASVAPFVDEIVLVDTGLPEEADEALIWRIAATVAENPPRLTYRQAGWRGDFSYHRNQTLAFAKCDWVFVLDSDEEVDERTGKLLRHLHLLPDIMCGSYIRLVNLLGGPGARSESFIWHPRLFRRGQVRYRGRVHNEPLPAGPMFFTDLLIRHHGYSEPEAMAAAKRERRRQMCQDWAEREPDNFIAWKYLAEALAEEPAGPEASGALLKAAAAGRTALDLYRAGGSTLNRAVWVAWPLLAALYRARQFNPCLEELARVIAEQPEHPDPHWLLLLVLEQMGAWQDICLAAPRFLAALAGTEADRAPYVLSEIRSYGAAGKMVKLWGRAIAAESGCA